MAHFNLAVALGSDGKLGEEMMSHFSEAVRIDPELRMKPQYILAQYNWANVLIGNDQLGRLDEAAGRLAEALHGKPDFAEAHNALGIDYLKQGKLDMAAAEFSEAIRLKPDYASAHNNLGTTLGNQGQLERAVSECAEAVRLDPNLTDARVNLQILLQKQGKTAAQLTANQRETR
jgi:tetratricopeptide (TPR) repeat protein